MNKYADWIRENYPDTLSARRQCSQATERMVRAFPELTRVRGHVICSEGFNEPHWWCVDPQGNVVDPTAHQWTGSITYMPIDESQPQPTGKCPNCGDYCYNDKYLCSPECERAYVAYCLGGQP